MVQLRPDAPLVETVKEVLRDYTVLRAHFIWALVLVRRGENPYADFGEVPGETKEDYIRRKSAYVRRRLSLMADNKFIERARGQRDYRNEHYNFHVYRLASSDEARHTEDSHTRNRSLSHKLAENELVADVEIGCFLNPHMRLIPSWEVALRFPEKTRTARNPFSCPTRISHEGFSTTLDVRPDRMFVIEYNKDGETLYRGFLLEANQSTTVKGLYENKQMSVEQRLSRKTHIRELLCYREISKGLYKERWNLPTMLMLNLATTNLKMRNLMSVNEHLTNGKGYAFALYSVMPKFGDLPPAFPTGETVTKPWMRVGHDPFIMADI